MLMQFLSTYQAFSGDMGVNRRILLDVLIRRLQNKSAAFNQAAGFSSPNTNRQTSRRYPISGGVFTSAFPCCTFPTGNRGTGGFMPAGYGLSSLLTRSFCSPPSRLAA